MKAGEWNHPAAILKRLHASGTGTSKTDIQTGQTTAADRSRNISTAVSSDCKNTQPPTGGTREADYTTRGTTAGAEYFENNVSPSSKFDVQLLQEEFATRQKMSMENSQVMLAISQKLASAGVRPGAGSGMAFDGKSINPMDVFSQMLAAAAATGFPMFGGGQLPLPPLVSPFVADVRTNNRICPSSATKETGRNFDDQPKVETPSKHHRSSTPDSVLNRREQPSVTDRGQYNPDSLFDGERKHDVKLHLTDRECPLMSSGVGSDFTIGDKTPMASLVELTGFGGVLQHRTAQDDHSELFQKGNFDNLVLIT